MSLPLVTKNNIKKNRKEASAANRWTPIAWRDRRVYPIAKRTNRILKESGIIPYSKSMKNIEINIKTMGINIKNIFRSRPFMREKKYNPERLNPPISSTTKSLKGIEALHFLHFPF